MYKFIDDKGTFELENAGANSYLYFPVCNEAGIMGTVTPALAGDLCLDQNRFVLQPTGAEDLKNNRNSRNFWLRFEDGTLRSATGNSVWQKALGEDKVDLRAGLLYQETFCKISHEGSELEAGVLIFAPATADTVEITRISIKNTGNGRAAFEGISLVPLYGRSAVNLRDHHHVTSLLNRIRTGKNGVYLKPVLSFDERGHVKNTTEYFSVGTDGKGQAPKGFFPTVMHVTGEEGDFTMPLGLIRREDGAMTTGVSENAVFEGAEAVGGLLFEKTELGPGETAEFIVITGARDGAVDCDKAEPLILNYGSADKVNNALEKNKACWQGKAEQALRTGGNAAKELAEVMKEPEEKVRNLLLWVAVQPVLRRIYGCSFMPYHDYGKGGRGWRDLFQDCLALMLADPSSVRELLINNFAGVRADGTNATIIGKEPGEFIADRNGIARVWMDHGVWPWITLKLYMELSGETSILDTEQVYFKDRLCMRSQAADSDFSEADDTRVRDRNGEVYRGSILEHILLMHVTAACDTGENGNIRLRGADWNDALDMAPARGESVAFTAAYAGNLMEMAAAVRNRSGECFILTELYDLIKGLKKIAGESLGQKEKSVARQELLRTYCSQVRHTVSGLKAGVDALELADALETIAKDMMSHIRANEMLKKGGLFWMNGYYDNEAERVEDLEDERLMLTGAVFGLMSGTIAAEDIDGVIRTADRYLFREKGGYSLNTRFKEPERYAGKLGRMFGFAYGTKENGAVFCHMAVMYSYALLIRGRRNEALKAAAALLGQALNFGESRMYPGIPEYFDLDGRGMYPYLTGAASWMLLLLYRIGQN